MPKPMLKAVLDTNVLISGVYFPSGTPGQVLALARKKQIQNITSPFILEEMERILEEKFLWQKARAVQAVRWVRSFSLVVQPHETLAVVAHASDNRILECALEGGARYLVSGDKHLKQLRRYQGIDILEPRAFLTAIGEGNEDESDR